MTYRAVTLLAGAALWMVPVAAHAQSEPSPFERVSDGFEALWNEAGESGLKLEEKPVDLSPLLVEVPTPWRERPYSDLESFETTPPPPVEGVTYGGDPIQNWLDWYDLEIDAAGKAKDIDRLDRAFQDRLFLVNSRVRSGTMVGPSSYEYQSEMRNYIAAIAPQVDLTGMTMREAVALTPEAAEELELKAFRAMPKARQDRFENALRHYLSLIAIEQVQGPPVEGDGLQDNGSYQLAMLEDLLRRQGRTDDHAIVAPIVAAMEENSKISAYNWSVSYRYQNLEMGNPKGAAFFAQAMVRNLSAAVAKDHPLTLRVLLLTVADHFAIGDTAKAGEFLALARTACSEAPACGNIAAHPAAQEGIALLESQGATAQLAAFRSALAGADPTASREMAALAALPALERELNICYGSAPVDPKTFAITPEVKLAFAECDFAIGPDIITVYEQAGTDFTKSQKLQSVTQDVAEAGLTLGKYAEVEPYFAQLVSAARADDLPYADDLALSHAVTLVETGRYAEADRVLAETRASSEALMLAGMSYPSDYSNRIRGIEALTVQRYLADPANAHLAYEVAKSRAEDFRRFRQSQVGSVRSETNLARIIGWNGTFLEAADAAWAFADKEPVRRSEARDVAFAAVQDALTDGTSLSLAYAMADRADFSTDPQTADLIARRRELLEMLAPYEGVEAKDRSFELPGSTREEIERRREFELVDALSEEYRTINRQLAQAAPDYFRLIRPEPLSLDDARAVLRDDEAVVMLVPAQGGTHAMVLTPAGVEWHRSEMTVAEIDTAVRRLLWFSGANVEINGPEQREWESAVDGGRNGFDRDTAYTLYSELLMPLESAFAGKRHLFVAAGGSLGSLPLGILVTGQPEGRDDDPVALRQTPWLARDANLVRIPSLQTLAYQRRFAGAADGSEAFRGFGDPVLDGEAQARSRGQRSGSGLTAASVLRRDGDVGGIANVARLRSLARLPGTEVELTAMARAFGSDRSALSLGAEATESRFKESDLSAVSVLALATHGLTAGEADGSGEPGLVFSPPTLGDSYDDGYLTASEVAQMRIGADWVILSACNTAAGDGSAGAPGLSGLARAFFYAGASNLLASHWPVRDDVAARLTVRTIELARDDAAMSRAEAFTAAMREIRDDSSADGKLVEGYDLTFAHPSAWAPFELIGDAGVR